MPAARWSRREFLGGAVAALAVLPEQFGGDPYRPLSPLVRPDRGAVRVRGRVAAGGRGLGRVVVSDGLRAVATGSDGRFELVSDASRPWLSLCVPSGYTLPVSATGMAANYRRIAPAGDREATAVFDLVPLPGSDDHHAFLALADIQTQDDEEMARYRDETAPGIRATLADLGPTPAFAVGLGDIMYDRLALYDQYEAVAATLGIPFVQVVGNHDLDLEEQSDGASTTTFERRFGPRYHSFNRGQIHYIVLDDVFYFGGGYIGYLDDAQLAWLAADLAFVEPGAPVVVFAHIPFLKATNTRGPLTRSAANHLNNREAAYRLLAPFRTTVLSGHIHENDFSTDGGILERNLGAVCGGWWTGDICYDGTPNGFGVFEARGAEVRWRYQATGHGREHQIRVYPWGADPLAPGEIVANVWAWEPGWTVRWFENGVARGEMARRVGLDPRSVALHAGPARPAKRTWVDPVPTGHLFYAPVPAGAGAIRVEATDPWGGVFSAALP